MKKISIKLIISLILSLLILNTGYFTAEAFAKKKKHKTVTVQKRKKIKRETINTRKQLINNFTKHIINYDKKFSYKINKKALKNFGKDFDKLWGEFTDHPAYNEMRKYSEINYNSWKSKGFLYLDVEVSYDISKNKAKKILKNLNKKIITSREELIEKYTSHILNMDKSFSFNISNKLMPYSSENTDEFLYELSKNPAYNDLLEHADQDSNYFEYKNYWEWVITPNFKISKEKGQKILEQVTPILNTEQEVIEQIIAHVGNLDRKFALNIREGVIGFDDSEYNKFWDKLNEDPRFNDIFNSSSSSTYSTQQFNGYIRYEKNHDYSIQKKEIDDLNTFIATWVQTNITPTMTEEEKVRAINDYMVREYRYTFGDRGELFGEEHGTEKLGNYSVYTSFSLLYGKGGVCNSKANMFYHLAKAAGLEVIYISGTGNGGDHAWNMVKVDGKWYHLDNTWNRGHYEGTSEYEYFNKSDYYLKGDNTMSRDHNWDRTKYPAAYEDYPIYNLPPVVSNTVYTEWKMAA